MGTTESTLMGEQGAESESPDHFISTRMNTTNTTQTTNRINSARITPASESIPTSTTTNNIHKRAAPKTLPMKILKGSVVGLANAGKSSLLHRLRGEDDIVNNNQTKSKRRMMALIPWSPDGGADGVHGANVAADVMQLHVVERHEVDYAALKKRDRSQALDLIVIVVDRTNSQSLDFVLDFLNGILDFHKVVINEHMKGDGKECAEKTGNKNSASMVGHLPNICILLNHFDLERDKPKSDQGDEDKDEDDISTKSATASTSTLTLAKLNHAIDTKVTRQQTSDTISERRVQKIRPLEIKCIDACMKNGYGLQALNSFIALPYLQKKERELRIELQRIQESMRAWVDDFDKKVVDGASFKELEAHFIDNIRARPSRENRILDQERNGDIKENLETIGGANTKASNDREISHGVSEGDSDYSGRDSNDITEAVGVQNSFMPQHKNERRDQNGRRMIILTNSDKYDEDLTDSSTSSHEGKDRSLKKKRKNKRGKKSKTKRNTRTAEGLDDMDWRMKQIEQKSRHRIRDAKQAKFRKPKPVYSDPKQALEAFLASGSESDNDVNAHMPKNNKSSGIGRNQIQSRNTSVLDSDDSDSGAIESYSSAYHYTISKRNLKPSFAKEQNPEKKAGADLNEIHKTSTLVENKVQESRYENRDKERSVSRASDMILSTETAVAGRKGSLTNSDVEKNPTSNEIKRNADINSETMESQKRIVALEPKQSPEHFSDEDNGAGDNDTKDGGTNEESHGQKASEEMHTLTSVAVENSSKATSDEGKQVIESPPSKEASVSAGRNNVVDASSSTAVLEAEVGERPSNLKSNHSDKICGVNTLSALKEESKDLVNDDVITVDNEENIDIIAENDSCMPKSENDKEPIVSYENKKTSEEMVSSPSSKSTAALDSSTTAGDYEEVELKASAEVSKISEVSPTMATENETGNYEAESTDPSSQLTDIHDDLHKTALKVPDIGGNESLSLKVTDISAGYVEDSEEQRDCEKKFDNNTDSKTILSTKKSKLTNVDGITIGKATRSLESEPGGESRDSKRAPSFQNSGNNVSKPNALSPTPIILSDDEKSDDDFTITHTEHTYQRTKAANSQKSVSDSDHDDFMTEQTHQIKQQKTFRKIKYRNDDSVPAKEVRPEKGSGVSSEAIRAAIAAAQKKAEAMLPHETAKRSKKSEKKKKNKSKKSEKKKKKSSKETSD